jgi:hypothetical protein
MYAVLRSFNDGDAIRVVGELVDGIKYRLLNELISQRYLMKYDGSSVCTCNCERSFVSQKDLDNHVTNHSTKACKKIALK